MASEVRIRSRSAVVAQCQKAILARFDGTGSPELRWDQARATANRDAFRRELFLFNQFNSHYLSWIKNEQYRSEYIMRVWPFFDYLMPLCRLNAGYRESVPKRGNDQPLRRWLLRQSIGECFECQRSLQLMVTRSPPLQTLGRSPRLLISLFRPDQLESKIPLGELDLQSGSTARLAIPLFINYWPTKMCIVVQLRRQDAPGNSFPQLLLSETDISGYNGCQREMSAGIRLSIEWAVDYAPVLNRVSIENMQFMSSALLYMGAYYFRFMENYFRIQCTKVPVAVRLGALPHLRRVLYTLFLVVEETEEVAELFKAIYHECSEQHLIPFDVHNLCWAFPYLNSTEQLHYLKQWQWWLADEPDLWQQAHLPLLIRLVRLVAFDSGNYSTGSLQSVVVPLVILLIRRCSAQVSRHDNKDNREPDQVPPPSTVMKLFDASIGLLIQCIDYLKPPNWRVLLLDAPDMELIRSVLQHLIEEMIADGHSLQFLYIIYLRLKSRRVLLDPHLRPFLTEDRLQTFHQSAAPVGDGYTSCVYYSK